MWPRLIQPLKAFVASQALRIVGGREFIPYSVLFTLSTDAIGSMDRVRFVVMSEVVDTLVGSGEFYRIIIREFCSVFLPHFYCPIPALESLPFSGWFVLISPYTSLVVRVAPHFRSRSFSTVANSAIFNINQ